jgi:hypothetical protein
MQKNEREYKKELLTLINSLMEENYINVMSFNPNVTPSNYSKFKLKNKNIKNIVGFGKFIYNKLKNDKL